MKTTILCPTRGGEAAVPNQLLAIQLARQQGTSLVFLYISNVHFLDHYGSAHLVPMEQQLDEIGDFVLAMAQERAEAQGVNALAEVRRGDFRQALVDTIRKHHVAVVVLGSSAEGTGIIDLAYREALTRYLLDEVGVEVIVTDQGALIKHLKPAGEE